MTVSKRDLAKLRSIASASLDATGILLDANEGFMRLISSDPDSQRKELLGQRVDIFFLQPSFAALAGSPAGAGGEVFQGMLTMGPQNGKTRTLPARVWREDGAIQVLAEHDIEEIERISDCVLSLNDDYAKAQFELAQVNLELRRFKEELEQRVADRTQALGDALVRADTFNRAKNAFLATVSHELRTPLAHIVGLADVLDQHVTDPKQHEQIGGILAASQRLIGLVDDMLMMSKVQADKFALESVEFDILEVAEDAADKMRDRAQAKGLALLRDFDPALPKVLRGDPARLGQILTHLLDNAVKFSSRGTITLRARWGGSSAIGQTVRFEVEDEGMGIAAEVQAAIFNSFEQADKSLTRQHGGTGLGLAICRQLVLVMGGEIGVSSTPGAGSLFWLDLPVRDRSALPESRDRAPVYTTLRSKT